MPLYTGLEFTKIFNWDGVGTAGSDYTDVTLEAQSPAGTSFTIFNTAAHYLYLGHTERFDMAVFDIDGAGSLGALTWEFYNGSAWTVSPATLTPARDRNYISGSTTACLSVAGRDATPGSYVNTCFTFDGTSWSSTSGYPVTNTLGVCTSGPSTDSLSWGGSSYPGTKQSACNKFDGTSWSALSAVPATVSQGAVANAPSGVGASGNSFSGGGTVGGTARTGTTFNWDAPDALTVKTVTVT